MKTKQTIALLFALAALHLGAMAQRDTAVVATAPVQIIPGGEKADTVQRAVPVKMYPGSIGHNADGSGDAETQCPTTCEPGSIGGK